MAASTSSQHLPREAVRSISGFSLVVAIAVTHPLCPASDPLYCNDSDLKAR